MESHSVLTLLDPSVRPKPVCESRSGRNPSADLARMLDGNPCVRDRCCKVSSDICPIACKERAPAVTLCAAMRSPIVETRTCRLSDLHFRKARASIAETHTIQSATQEDDFCAMLLRGWSTSRCTNSTKSNQPCLQCHQLIDTYNSGSRAAVVPFETHLETCLAKAICDRMKGS